MLLFINPTEKNSIALRLYKSKKLFSQIKLRGGIKITERLVESIQKFLAKNNLELSNLAGIILAIGPGGFTSLRICCVIVNTLCQLKGIPSFGAPISQLDADEKIISAMKKLKTNQILLPAYDREPNITIPKN